MRGYLVVWERSHGLLNHWEFLAFTVNRYTAELVAKDWEQGTPLDYDCEACTKESKAHIFEV